MIICRIMHNLSFRFRIIELQVCNVYVMYVNDVFVLYVYVCMRLLL